MAKRTLKEKLADKKEELERRGNKGNIIFQKADTTIRVRILNMGEEEEFIKEITQFYLGGEIKGVISPITFAEPCAINDAYEELKASKDDDDKALAGTFTPKKKYLAWVALCKDTKGKEWEDEPKFVLLSAGQYTKLLDLYLDEDDWGDMTDPEEGYDVKLKRIGSSMTDTVYSASPCKPTRTHKTFRDEIYDLDEEVRNIMPTFEETEKYLDQFLGTQSEEEDDEPKKKKKKKKKKKVKRDLDE